MLGQLASATQLRSAGTAKAVASLAAPCTRGLTPSTPGRFAADDRAGHQSVDSRSRCRQVGSKARHRSWAAAELRGRLIVRRCRSPIWRSVASLVKTPTLAELRQRIEEGQAQRQAEFKKVRRGGEYSEGPPGVDDAKNRVTYELGKPWSRCEVAVLHINKVSCNCVFSTRAWLAAIQELSKIGMEPCKVGRSPSCWAPSRPYGTIA